MGRVSPGMDGGWVLISPVSRARARAARGSPGGSRVTVIAAGVQVMVPARPRMMVWRVTARYSSSRPRRRVADRDRVGSGVADFWRAGLEKSHAGWAGSEPTVVAAPRAGVGRPPEPGQLPRARFPSLSGKRGGRAQGPRGSGERWSQGSRIYR